MANGCICIATRKKPFAWRSTGANYVLTTGTGSGKSLAYIVPIVDHVVRKGSGKGISAIVVYPMNALANSQFGELEKFIRRGFAKGQEPVRFETYTGQESNEKKEAIVADPPDILLTNYVMLELIMTRPRESNLIQSALGLRFLVLDELHTYRGRQGSDVAMLVRRVRDRLEAENLQCVGTSATLASGGTFDEQRVEIARVASNLFGAEVAPANVIGETLRRATPDPGLNDPAFQRELHDRLTDAERQPPTSYKEFVADPFRSGSNRLLDFEAKREPTASSAHDRRASPVPRGRPPSWRGFRVRARHNQLWRSKAGS